MMSSGFFPDTARGKELINEALIEGNKVHYDAASSFSLEDAKAYYEPLGYKYIGSGHITFHNGVENKWEKQHHFFIKKQNA